MDGGSGEKGMQGVTGRQGFPGEDVRDMYTTEHGRKDKKHEYDNTRHKCLYMYYHNYNLCYRAIRVILV